MSAQGSGTFRFGPYNERLRKMLDGNVDVYVNKAERTMTLLFSVDQNELGLPFPPFILHLGHESPTDAPYEDTRVLLEVIERPVLTTDRHFIKIKTCLPVDAERLLEKYSHLDDCYRIILHSPESENDSPPMQEWHIDCLPRQIKEDPG